MVTFSEDKEEKKRQRRLRILEKQRKLRIDACVRALMKHIEGRDYLYWLLEISKIGQNPFTANALTTAFNCGEVNVGQQIQAHIIEVDPEGYLSMLRDRERERIDNATGTSSGPSDPGTEPEPGEPTDPGYRLDTNDRLQ